MILVVKLAAKIKELAELRDWSLRKIAENSGVPPSTLHNALSRRGAALNVQDAIKISRMMDVPVEWLFDDAKEWDDLQRRPFWLPPGITPGQAIRARRKFEESLAKGPPDGTETAGRKHSARQETQSSTARPGEASGRRRKSGA